MHGLFISFLGFLYVVEARVYCQDSNASPWMPLGFTCPVICQNIVSAIEKLKQMDFENIINGQDEEVTTLNYKIPLPDKDDTISNHIDIDDNIIPYSDNNHLKNIRTKTIHFDEENSITNSKNYTLKNSMKDFKHANVSVDDQKLYKDITKIIETAKSSGCTKYRKVGFISKLKKCTRRVNYDKGFLKIVTKLLNTYVKSQYKFTADMTEVLLEKIIGKNTDLRHDIIDVNNLLRYLRAAIHMNKEQENPNKISLKSKRCLTISLPGCFCRSGYVESAGQCVKPSDCIHESIHSYLSRVVVL